MGKQHRLAELQLAIMQVLWANGASTVNDVRDALSNRKLAYTTIGTMLTKLEEKGLIKHRVIGRQNLYQAAVKQATVRQTMLDDLVQRLFKGDVTAMVSQLLGGSQITTETIESLKELIAQRERELDKECDDA